MGAGPASTHIQRPRKRPSKSSLVQRHLPNEYSHQTIRRHTRGTSNTIHRATRHTNTGTAWLPPRKADPRCDILRHSSHSRKPAMTTPHIRVLCRLLHRVPFGPPRTVSVTPQTIWRLRQDVELTQRKFQTRTSPCASFPNRRIRRSRHQKGSPGRLSPQSHTLRPLRLLTHPRTPSNVPPP